MDANRAKETFLKCFRIPDALEFWLDVSGAAARGGGGTVYKAAPTPPLLRQAKGSLRNVRRKSKRGGKKKTQNPTKPNSRKETLCLRFLEKRS